jgi:hypothetical protein
VADATLASVTGFQRLHADIARAGFLASPNIQADLRRCGPPNPNRTELRRMAALRIEPDSPVVPQVVTDNQLSPDTIVLAGSYAAAEEFDLGGVTPSTGGGYLVDLQRRIGAALRLGLTGTDADVDLTLLEPIFQAGRGIRLLDQTGMVQYGTIAGIAVSDGSPRISVTADSALRLRAGQSTNCGLAPTPGGGVSVVNFVRYQIASLQTDPGYAPVYADTTQTQWDAGRTELVRDELDTAGQPIPGSAEIVAEHAVDLAFGVTFVSAVDANGQPGQLMTLLPDNAQIATLMGDAFANLGVAVPHRARAVRVRLSVRSREPDRRAPVTERGTGNTPSPNIAPGLYRFGMGPRGGAPFARVRTLQADVALHNLMGVPPVP